MQFYAAAPVHFCSAVDSRQAGQALAHKIGQRRVVCRAAAAGLLPLAVTVAVCRVGGIDLGGELVERGWAVATDAVYAEREALAREKPRGIWRSKFTPPRDWRGGIRLPGEGLCGERRSREKRCVIKGNISVENGEKIYHVPGGSYYRVTIIDPSKGERWFCSEADARAAGWRRSKR